MNVFSRFFAPPNALILSYDHFTDEDAQKLDARLDAIRKYYRFTTLSQIADPLAAGKALGQAAIVFRHARKGVVLRALPILRGHDVPCTVFLRADCVGLNRLPAEEEIALFAEGYPDKLSLEEVQRRLREGWSDPDGLDRFLIECRRTLGPLPIEKFDPTRFMSTWGKLLEFAPESMELGVNFGSDPAHPVSEQAVQFQIRQTGRVPRVACSVRSLSGSRAVLDRLGIRAVVGEGEGAVEKGANLLDLPVWRYQDAEGDPS